MDIRNYFSRSSVNDSGMSALRRGPKTPENKVSAKGAKSPVSKQQTGKKRKSESKILSSDSDPEDPVPSKLSKKLEKSQTKQVKPVQKPTRTKKSHVVVESDSGKSFEDNESKKFTNIRKSPRRKKNDKKNGRAVADVEILEYTYSTDDDEDFEDPKKAVNKKQTKTKSVKKTEQKSPQKRRSSSKIIDSDVDDDEFKTPATKKGKLSKKEPAKIPSPFIKQKQIAKKEESPSKKPAKNVPKLNPVTVSDFFGGAKVNKTKLNQNETNKKQVVEIEDHDDDEFNETLKNAEKDLISQTSSTISAAATTTKTQEKLLSPAKNRQKTPVKLSPVSKNTRSSTKSKNSLSESPSITPKPTKLLTEIKTKTPSPQKSGKKSEEKVLLKQETTPKQEIKPKQETKPKQEIKPKQVEVSIVAAPTSDSYLPWVEKYKPTALKQIIGQQGDKSCMKKLLNWLQNWKSWHITKTKEKKKGYGANDDGSFFKAVLLSGSPGIGKTTTAQMCCKELGFNYIELNASDARNKKTLQQKIAESLNCHSMDEYLKESDKIFADDDIRHVLIMDEVDGMSGNEDRAGVGELILLIKKTRTPIICICNDRQAQKIRSLSNYCYDLRFHKPQVAQIRGPLMSIAYKEGLKIGGQAMDQIIEGANHDIRQILNHLNLLTSSSKEISLDQATSEAKKAGKDTVSNIFETVRTLFSHNEETKNFTLNDRAELFFTDYSAIPLFVHENYLNVEQKEKRKVYEKLALVSKAAESMAMGDIVEKQIRTGGNWGLLNDQAMFSAVTPAERLKGYLQGMTQFPQWFGKNSKQGRLQRLLQQLQVHASLKISSNFTSLNLDYIPALRTALTKPLINEDSAGVEKVLNTLEAYDLTKEDMNNIIELGQFPSSSDVTTLIPSKVKAALTRTYNKEHVKLPYASAETVAGKKGKRAKAEGNTSAIGAELEVDEEGVLKEIRKDDDDEQGEEEDSGGEEINEVKTNLKPSSKPVKKSPAGKRGGKTAAASSSRGRGPGRK